MKLTLPALLMVIKKIEHVENLVERMITAIFLKIPTTAQW